MSTKVQSPRTGLSSGECRLDYLEREGFTIFGRYECGYVLKDARGEVALVEVRSSRWNSADWNPTHDFYGREL